MAQKLWISFLIVFTVGVVVTGFLPRNDESYSPNFEIITEPNTIKIDNPDWVYRKSYNVTITVYHATEDQCDDTPNILADGTEIDVRFAGDYRYCALSRDLLSRWGGIFDYGDTVLIDGALHLSGAWIVKDTMHPRWKNRVDLLVDQDTRPYKFETAKLRSL